MGLTKLAMHDAKKRVTFAERDIILSTVAESVKALSFNKNTDRIPRRLMRIDNKKRRPISR
jgi:hypothetical protein